MFNPWGEIDGAELLVLFGSFFWQSLYSDCQKPFPIATRMCRHLRGSPRCLFTQGVAHSSLCPGLVCGWALGPPMQRPAIEPRSH